MCVCVCWWEAWLGPPLNPAVQSEHGECLDLYGGGDAMQST